MKYCIVHSMRPSVNVFIMLCAIMSSVELKLPPEVIVDWESYHFQYFDICVNETGVDPMIPRMMFRQVNLPDEESFHCYMKCTFKYHNMLTPDEKDIDYEAYAKDVHLTPEILKMCREFVASESEICRKTYLITKCSVENKVISSGR
ncbi:hypothetical protein PPYR_09214 [Photinus pyralis]|uniref:Uncharacterized protein n=2 Tax=Photinus pyralis TaxID=7054 RepID=A0A5N4ALM7_PHOPY|nr:uncharacterized protein LOC116172346 [Photinus pyralis]KAB0798221.1 hypothetical protein PPYR_09214 [Photinus pyralis]